MGSIRGQILGFTTDSMQPNVRERENLRVIRRVNLSVKGIQVSTEFDQWAVITEICQGNQIIVSIRGNLRAILSVNRIHGNQVIVSTMGLFFFRPYLRVATDSMQ